MDYIFFVVSNARSNNTCNKLVENMIMDEMHDYSITKTVYYDEGGRQANYHLYRKDEDTQNIVKLVHDSYFILPSENASDIDGSQYNDILLFDELLHSSESPRRACINSCINTLITSSSRNIIIVPLSKPL